MSALVTLPAPCPCPGKTPSAQVENNPELRPLKEALQAAQSRRDEATGIREALEAEVGLRLRV